MIEIAKPIFGIVIILLAILAAMMAFKATRNDKSDFDFAEAFADDNGKTSLGRIAYFVALACSSWAFIFLTIRDNLTEWYYTGYMASWVFGALGSKWLDKKDAG